GLACGNFGASGLLRYDTAINFRADYIKRKSFYYVKTMKNIIGEYIYQSETVEGDYIKQLYQNGQLKAYVVWMKSESDASSLKTINFATGIPYQVVSFNSTETGSMVTGTGPVSLVVSETPKIILFDDTTVNGGSESSVRHYFLAD
ncbi:MAG: hypothetical protein WAT19_11925, partial [Ferruginibacter sp.]